ncbi:hypothetical protein NBRC106471_2851 [Acetobacter pasteurianus subsp. pasteurianus LMG 1262 = NBRC 106471]|nr:hypothetical protein NBRC106471_2851 [Acetobacter pasteurianus subsp. pasteurianus LMG 1262 = NBRC 106471]
MRILVRGDSGFARDTLMTWCEDNHVDFLFGLAGNTRLYDRIASLSAEVRDAEISQKGCTSGQIMKKSVL